MNGLALSLVWMLVVVAVTIFIVHRRSVISRFQVACGVFVAGLIGLLASVLLAPAAGPEPVVDALNGLYFYGFWFFGVFAQLYFLADRGFSLTMLTDSLCEGTAGRTREEIKRAYAGGAGMAYVKEKRLRQLVEIGWIRQERQRYLLTPVGRRVGRLCLRLQQLYLFRETG